MPEYFKPALSGLAVQCRTEFRLFHAKNFNCAIWEQSLPCPATQSMSLGFTAFTLFSVITDKQRGKSRHY